VALLYNTGTHSTVTVLSRMSERLVVFVQQH